MPYGSIKVDNIIFTDGGADQTTTVSGVYRAITSGVAVSGTISGATIYGVTVSGTTVNGVTVTGTTASFTTGTFTTLTGTTTTVTSGIFGAGSVTAPSVAVGVGTTYKPGVYSPGTDQLAISTNGTGRLFVDASGRVGIGTSSPQAQLQVLDRIKVSNSDQSQGSIVLGDGSSTTFNVGIARWNGGSNAAGAGGLGYFSQGTGNVGGHYFYTGDAAAGSQTARMTIAAGGNVGIGTTSPTQQLHVKTDQAAYTWARIDNQNSSASAYSGLQIGAFGNSWGIAIGSSAANSNSLTFVLDAGGSNSEKLRIDTSGRLLVGTSSNPTSSLIQVSQTNNLSSTTVDATTAGGMGISSSNTAANYGGGLWFEHGSLKAGIASSRITTSNWGTDLRFYTHFDTTSNQYEVYERMRIDSSGNVGIGTTSPGAPLEIYAATNPELRLNTSADGYLQIGQFTNGAFIGPSSSDSVDGVLRFGTGGTERARIDSSGNVGIGTTSPATALNVQASAGEMVRATVSSNTALYANIGADGNGGWFGSNADLSFKPSGTERARIDTSGRLLVGTSTGPSDSTLVLQGNSSNATFNSVLRMLRNVTNPAADTVLGSIIYGVGSAASAGIECYADAQWAANDYPGRLVFSTTADGAASPTERMRIPNGGGLSVGSTVNPNALTQTSGIRLGANTIASYDFTNITTSPVTIANGVGIGGLAFVQAYNTADGAQYTGIIMWRSGTVAVVSESNALGFSLTYSVSGSTLRLQTASGTVTGTIISMGS